MMGSYWINGVLEADFAGIDRELISVLSDKVLAVSGATGFLGSLLSRLVIWANDEFGLGARLVLCVRNAAKLDAVMPGVAAREDVVVAEVDFLRPCEALCADFDYLVHTAAITASRVMVERPADVLNNQRDEMGARQRARPFRLKGSVPVLHGGVRKI